MSSPFMGRQSDPRKAAAWERRLARFSDSGLTVSRFCDREGVSIATFHSRERKLRAPSLDEAAWSMPAALMARFDPVEVISRQALTIRFAGGAVMISLSVRALTNGSAPSRCLRQPNKES